MLSECPKMLQWTYFLLKFASNACKRSLTFILNWDDALELTKDSGSNKGLCGFQKVATVVVMTGSLRKWISAWSSPDGSHASLIATWHIMWSYCLDP